MRIKGYRYKNFVSVDDVVNRVALFVGLYCWIVGTLAAVFPHPPWVVASLLIMLFSSTAITALAIRFSPDELGSSGKGRP